MPSQLLLLCKSNKEENREKVLKLMNTSLSESELVALDGEGRNALYLACAHKWADVVEKILKYSDKYDLNCISSSGITPFMRACKRGYSALPMLFLATSVNTSLLAHLSKTKKDGIMYACKLGLDTVVDKLVNDYSSLVPTLALDKDLNSFITLAILHCSETTILNILNKYSDQFLIKNIEHFYLGFSCACYKQNDNIIKYFIGKCHEILNNEYGSYIETESTNSSLPGNSHRSIHEQAIGSERCLMYNGVKKKGTLLSFCGNTKGSILLLKAFGDKCNIEYNNFECFTSSIVSKNRANAEYILDTFSGTLKKYSANISFQCNFEETDLKIVSQLINLGILIKKTKLNISEEGILILIKMIDSQYVIRFLVEIGKTDLIEFIIEVSTDSFSIQNAINNIDLFNQMKLTSTNINECLLCLGETQYSYVISPCEHVVSVCRDCISAFKDLTKCIVCRTYKSHSKQCYIA